MATFELEKDGKTYEVEAPDQAAALSALPHLEAAGQAKPPSGAAAVATDVAKEGGKGLLRGAASFVGDIGEAVMGPFGPAHHAGNLMADIGLGPRPKTEPTYGAQISKAAGIEPSPQTTPGKYASSVGEVAGNPASYLGPGSALMKGSAAVLSGVGSEAAGELAENFKSPTLEAGARMVGGLAGPAGATAAAERNLGRLASQLPSHAEIKASANQIYDSLKTSNVQISPQGMDELVRQIKTDLNAEGFRSWEGAPGSPIFKVADELGTSGGTIQGIDAVRKVLGKYKPDPSNAFAADMAVDAIDDFLMHVDPRYVVSGNPAQDAQALKYAQGLWATHKQLQTIEEGSIRGQHRAGVSGSGANRINTARQEIRKILDSDKKSRGMSQAVKDKMEEIVMGTWLTNRARQIGKFAPSGPVSASASILTGMGAGPGAGAAVATGGLLSKYLGEYLTDKQIRELEQMIRGESPTGAPIAKANAPRIAEQRAAPAAAAIRSGLTSPLATDSPLSQGVQ